MDPADREAVAKTGHPHGVIRSLVDYWADKSLIEPEYSLRAIEELHRAAASGLERPAWDALARLTVGSKGARWLADKTGTPSVKADDSAEPDAEPNHPGGTGVETVVPTGDAMPNNGTESFADEDTAGRDGAE